MANEKQVPVSSGVEELIARLRDEAIQAGRDKAEAIVLDAQKRAKWLIDDAQQEAERVRKNAQAEADALRDAGLDALKLASRDALLKLRDTLLGRFSHDVMRLVGDSLNKTEVIQQLIVTLAGRVREQADLDDAADLRILLPERVVGVDELRTNPELLKSGELSRLTAAIASDLLRDGVAIAVSEDVPNGIVIRLVDRHMHIDFTDEAIATLLLNHLQPRFRALLQGIIK